MPDENARINRRRTLPMDEHVGKRIRLRRRLLGLTQSELANRMGVTFQQVQKYEWGANRVGAGRLYDLSIALDVPIQYFFDAAPGQQSQQCHSGLSMDNLLLPDTLAMISAYNAIDSADCRARLLDLCEAMAKWPQSKSQS